MKMAVQERRPDRHPTRPRLRIVNAFTCWILHARLLRRLADHQVIELRFTGTRTGKPVALPVMYAQHGDQLVVLVGGPDAKRWWRNFRKPHPVRVLLRGVTRTGIGHLTAPGTSERAEAAAIYKARFPDIPVRDDPVVVITLDPAK